MTAIPHLASVEASEKPALSRILAEAEALFAEHGYDGVSIHQVACAAGVCKANIFHHFASKQDLYGRVLAQACAEFGQSLDGLQLSERGLAARLAQLMDWHYRFLRQRPRGTQLILREMMESSERLTQGPVFVLVKRNFERVVGLLAESQDEMRDGIGAAQLAKLVLSMNLFGYQTEHLDRRLSAQGSLAPQSPLQHQWLDVLLHGVLRRS